MTGDEILARLEAAGASLRGEPDGSLRLRPTRPLPPALLAEARAKREELAAALVARERQAQADAFRKAQAEALEALAWPDPELAWERAEIARAQAEEGRPLDVTRHRAVLEGLLRAARGRSGAGQENI
ncbi:hypothetical protein NON00_02530 [Roseomonas sp. GC11]|uniref:hypothetical protein n=1 Tax=Roseomonas sp. GC11 TaxID=2950546 RepID=UPI00210C606D|nr:hypothetical protein [Roseomonas sp. GC11]MCQ4158803.1 hypothetical protein [Roseomonas sp. GC11]